MLARVEGRGDAKVKECINLIDEQEEALYRVGDKANPSATEVNSSMIEI